MEAKKYSDYKFKGEYMYPSEKVNPEIKRSDEYCLAYCEAFMSEYVNNMCETPFEFGSNYSYERLRQYATGMEGNDEVKKSFFGAHKKNPQTGKYETTINTSWNGMDVMPKMFDVMRSINQKVDYRTTTRTVDRASVQSKRADREYLKFMMSDEAVDLVMRAKFKPSMPVDLKAIGAETEGDVDLYFDTGAFVTQREIASEAAVNKTRRESSHRVIQDMVYDDLITIAIAGIKTYIAKGTKVVKYRYCDPAKCIIPYSKYLDFRNIPRAAELRTMTIGELREEFPHITGAQWLSLAKDYAYMNPEYRNLVESSGSGYFGNRDNARLSIGVDPVNSCKILVMDAQWLSTDYEKYLTNENKDNLYKEVSFGYDTENDPRSKKSDKVIQKKVIKKYQAFWVVGTKIMLDCGLCDDQVYYGPDGMKTPKLDYFFAKTGNKSLVERCIDHIEDIHMAAVKRRNAIAKLPPAPRMIIQQQLIDNVYLNGIRQQPEDLYLKFTEDGKLVVNNLDDFNKPIFQNSKAIEFVPAGILEDIALFTNEIKEGIERIREVTGLNQAVDASTPNSYVGLGKSQMAAAAANNALSPTFNCYGTMVTDAMTDVVKKWQIIAGNNKGMTVEYSPLGTSTMQNLALDEDFCNADFNIYTEMEFTEDEKRSLLAKIVELNATFKNSQGASGINTAELIHLEELIMSGSFKFAKYFIAKTEMKRERAAMKFKRESEENTFKNQRATLAMNNKFEAERIDTEERKKLLTNRVTEAEKRKTKLTEALADGQKQTEGSGPINVKLIEDLIAKTDIEIQAMLAADLQADQIHEQNVAQVA